MLLTLSQYVALIGLNAQGATFLGQQSGAYERTGEEWASLLAHLLSEPDTAWLAGCFTGLSPATVGGEALPVGEGFFERHLGAVQATPLLSDVTSVPQAVAYTTTYGDLP